MSIQRNKTILVIDDSRVSRMFSRDFVLKLRPDWIVEEAGSGEEALEKLQNIVADYVLLDVNMPGMGGYETIAKLRELYPTLSVCVLTANIQEASRDKVVALGASFAEKPITAARIEQIVTAWEMSDV